MRDEETYTCEYVTGLAEFERLARDPAFLDFVGLLDAEGSREEWGSVSLSTADPTDGALAAHWIRRLSGSRVSYALDFELGHDVVELVRFWSGRLDVDHEQLRLRRRRFDQVRLRAVAESSVGVVTIRSTDPVLRIRLQAWTDKARANLIRVAGAERTGTDRRLD